MGYTNSTVHGIPVPDSAQANNVPTDLQGVVNIIETGSLIKRLTSTQIAALTSAQKPAGLVVYNTTANKLQVSNGSTFTDVIDASGGTMGSALAMGGSKITGLGAGTANGDAVRYEQAVLLAGSTMTGALTLSGAPSSANHAATKAYVDAVGTWSAWTPSWVSGTSATVTSARYSEIGKTVHWSMNVSAASGGDLDFTLPVTAASTVRSVGHYSVPLNTHFGTTSYLDFGPVLMVVADATRAVFQRISQDASAAAATLSGSTVGSIGFHASGTYEAA